MNDKKLYDSFKLFLEAIEEDPLREGIKDTPERMVKAWKEWLRGYDIIPNKIKSFTSKYKGIVARKNIPFQSICEHHIAPYRGFIDFAYIPNGKIVGLSKIPRIFQHYACILSVQEELTTSLLDMFYDHIEVKPKGAMIIIEASHTCESSRGVKVDAPTITSEVRGLFQKDLGLKDETLRLLGR